MGEDNTHILDCGAADTMVEWDVVSIRVYEWLDSRDSRPELARLMMRALEKWKNKTPVEYGVESDFPGMIFSPTPGADWIAVVPGWLFDDRIG